MPEVSLVTFGVGGDLPHPAGRQHIPERRPDSHAQQSGADSIDPASTPPSTLLGYLYAGFSRLLGLGRATHVEAAERAEDARINPSSRASAASLYVGAEDALTLLRIPSDHALTRDGLIELYQSRAHELRTRLTEQAVESDSLIANDRERLTQRDTGFLAFLRPLIDIEPNALPAALESRRHMLTDLMRGYEECQTMGELRTNLNDFYVQAIDVNDRALERFRRNPREFSYALVNPEYVPFAPPVVEAADVAVYRPTPRLSAFSPFAPSVVDAADVEAHRPTPRLSAFYQNNVVTTEAQPSPRPGATGVMAVPLTPSAEVPQNTRLLPPVDSELAAVEARLNQRNLLARETELHNQQVRQAAFDRARLTRRIAAQSPRARQRTLANMAVQSDEMTRVSQLVAELTAEETGFDPRTAFEANGLNYDSE